MAASTAPSKLRLMACLIDGKKVKVFKETDPAAIPWKDLGVDIVNRVDRPVHHQGRWRQQEGQDRQGRGQPHHRRWRKKVIISAPAEGEDLTVVWASTRTSTILPSTMSFPTLPAPQLPGPAAKVVHDKYIIKRAFMTTVHSYTNDQKVLDLPHSDLRRARAAGLNIIPTTPAPPRHRPGYPDLKGKFDGYSLRVRPRLSRSSISPAEIEKEATTEELRQAFRDAAKEPRLKGILEAVDEPLVSMDFKGSSYSSSVDLPFTSVLGKEKSTFIKVVTWYDNEWGYSVRTADLANFDGEQAVMRNS